MMRLRKSPVVFDESTHSYNLNDRKLSGITSLIYESLGLGYDTESNPAIDYYVHKAAEYGTSVHKAIRNYDEMGVKMVVWHKSDEFKDAYDDHNWNVSQELESYIRNKKGFDAVANEYTVSDEERYASQIDNVWRKVETGEIWLVDTKTNNIKYYPGGKKMLIEYLSWQLSIYAYLFEKQNPDLKVSKLACNWLRGADSEFIEIQFKPIEDVVELLSTDWEVVSGKFEYAPTHLRDKYYGVTAQAKEVKVAKTVIKSIASMIRKKEESERKVDELKAKLRDAMEMAGVKSWDSGLFKATIANDAETTTFDSKRFKEDHPELYKQYTKTSIRRGGFTIKLSE